MVGTRPSVTQVWGWLADVPDPEIPAVSVVDLGIVREVWWTADGAPDELRVAVTPTYAGCPATRTIARDIERALHERGIARVALEVRLAPPWTTDWIRAEAREKLRAYGIAPPGNAADPLALRARPREPVACPRCGSSATSRTSEFGSTPCKALYRCDACREPFDHFKCH